MRDWGHAKDYVEGMWLMLQQQEPSDFVLATGMARSVRDLVEVAFGRVGRNLTWDGEGVEEKDTTLIPVIFWWMSLNLIIVRLK